MLLTTFHRQEQKSLGFWVFFVVLQWVLQLSLKQMMTQVLENLVIYGTNVWNRFDRGSLDNPPVHLFFASALANVFECSGLKPFLFRIASFTKSTMLELGVIEPSKTNCPLSFHLMTSEWSFSFWTSNVTRFCIVLGTELIICLSVALSCWEGVVRSDSEVMVRSVCVIIWTGDGSGLKTWFFSCLTLWSCVNTWWPLYLQAHHLFLTNHSFLV